MGVYFSECENCLLRSFSLYVQWEKCIELPLPWNIIVVHIWGGTVNNKHLSSTKRISFGSGNPWTKNCWLQGENFGNKHVFLPCAYLKAGYVHLWIELESLLACYNINFSLLADKKKGIHTLFFFSYSAFQYCPQRAFSFQLRNHSSLSCPDAVLHAVAYQERFLSCLLSLFLN